MEVISPKCMLYQTLECACSQNTEYLKSAEQKLKQWETEPGFYSMLMQLFTDNTINGNVRWMAAVYFKNGVNKYWRKNIQNEISQSEKVLIKSALISSFNEAVPQIYVQIAALIARIARLDCPKEWPELIPTLLNVIQSTNELEQTRSLLTLHHVVKALSSKRLMSDRKVFEELTENIFPFVLNLWNNFSSIYYRSVKEKTTDDTAKGLLERALLTIRILRKLTIHGFHKPFTSDLCMQFTGSIFSNLKDALYCRLQTKSINAIDLTELTEKIILKQMKILNETLELHPVSFMDFVPDSLEFSFNYVFNEGTNMIYENNKITFIHFIIHCINLMKGILSSSTYNSYIRDKNYPDVPLPLPIVAKKEFFTKNRLNYICEKMILHYFLLTPDDLNLWIDDPESFASDEGGESWKYSLRPCIESFFSTLYSQFRKDMTEELIKYVQKAQSTTLHSNSDLKDILEKDAIYNAAGLSAFNLFDEVDFDEWFTKQLLIEIQIKNNNFRIIRRRAIWLIGQWTSVKLSRNLRPQVYVACLELLQPNEDIIVRLAASRTLMSTLDDFEFESQHFLQYLEPSFSSLFTLLKDAKECDTKMNVLYIMSFIVDKMSDNIEKEADKLIQYLPLLWEQSKDHNMLRCAIISTLVQIVKAFSEIPATLASFLYPVIGLSTNKEEDSYIYLLEDGLELWLVVIENSTSLSPELLELACNIIPIIENTSEYLRTSLYIVHSYILLDPHIFLRRFGEDLVKTCVYLSSDMRSEGIVMIMKIFEVCLRSNSDYAIELLMPTLGSIFMKVCNDQDFGMVMTMYLGIIARVLLINQSVFVKIVQDMNISDALDRLLDVWIKVMPSVTQPDKRKLLGLALSSLLTVQCDTIYSRLGGILLNIAETLNDIMKEDSNDNSTMIDSLILTDDVDLDYNGMWNMQEFEYKTYHYQRCRSLCLRDPVHTIVLKDFFASQIELMKTQLGPEQSSILFSSVDYDILRNLSEHVGVNMANL